MLNKKIKIMFLVCILTLTLFTAVSVVLASNPTPENPATIRISYNATTMIDCEVLQWEEEQAMAAIFKNIVESRTDGAIKVKLYPNSQLGGAKDSVEMVMSGTIEGAIGTSVLSGFFPEFEVFSIPYLFKSEEIAWEVFDNSKYWANLKENLRKKTGLRLMAMGQNGVRNFTHNSKFIKSPEDLKSEKFRVMQNPIYVKMMKAFNAIPVPMAFVELYTSLKTNVIQGEENPVSVIVANKLYEVQHYLTLDAHTWSEDAFVLNDKFYNSLPKEMQVILNQAARQAEIANRGSETIHSNGVGLKKCIEKGMKVYVPTMKEKMRFEEVAQPPVIEYLKEKIGEAVVNGMLDAVDEAEQKLGYK